MVNCQIFEKASNLKAYISLFWWTNLHHSFFFLPSLRRKKGRQEPSAFRGRGPNRSPRIFGRSQLGPDPSKSQMHRIDPFALWIQASRLSWKKKKKACHRNRLLEVKLFHLIDHLIIWTNTWMMFTDGVQSWCIMRSD